MRQHDQRARQAEGGINQMKNRRMIWWIIVIALAPFVLMLLLHIGIALQQYFKFNINVPNIHAAEWFMFAGSYLGGAMTLFGVIITLKYERKLHQHQLMIESIEKERERLFAIINKLDVFAPSACHLDFTSAMCFKEWNKRPDFSAVRRRIIETLRELNQSNQELQLETEMCSVQVDCVKCKHPCKLPEIRNEFQSVYAYVNKYLFDTLQMLDAYIVDQYQNAAKDELINSYLENIVLCQAQGKTPKYGENDIDSIQKQKKDLSIQQADLDKRLHDILAMNQKEMVRLINLVREYCALRIQNAERIHMSEK